MDFIVTTDSLVAQLKHIPFSEYVFSYEEEGVCLTITYKEDIYKYILVDPPSEKEMVHLIKILDRYRR